MEISRRKVLLGGAARRGRRLSVASPASAKALWTWKPSGSVAGQGTGADPKWVWDDETDPLVASLLDRGDVPRVNELLRDWRYNSQPLPTGLPTDVRDYIEYARRTPSWTSQAKLDQALQFYTKRRPLHRHAVRVRQRHAEHRHPQRGPSVYYSKGGADMRTASPRRPSSGTTSATRTPTSPTAT